MNLLVAAAAAPIDGTKDIADMLLEILTKGLTVAAGVPGIPGVIFLAVLAAIVAVILVSKAVMAIAKYFSDENKRKEEAYLTSQKREQEQAAILEQITAGMSKNIQNTMDAAFKHDYDYYVARIKAKQFDCYDKIPEQFWLEVGAVVRREDLTPEDRAARIILIVRRK